MRWPGTCALCTQPVFEIRETVPEMQHLGREDRLMPKDRPKAQPFAGKAKKIGRVHPGTRRVQLVLLSGNRSDITLCAGCNPDPDGLLQIWKNCTELMAAESTTEYRQAMSEDSRDRLTDEQRYHNQKMTCLFWSDRPIGVLSDIPWEEFQNGNAT